MSAAEEQFIIEEEWLEEDFIGGAAYEEVVVEDVEVREVKPTNPLQRSLSSADFSFDGSTIVEFDLGSYNGEWSSGEGEPDNYEEACRKLIKLVYPQGGSHDADDMIRRCDLKNLYRNLKQQHKLLIHTKKSLAECDGKLERWESFDDSNGAFSVEAVDQAIISFGEPPNEGEIQHKQGINDEQKWPDIEDFANPWESKQYDELSTENPSENDDPIIGSAAVEETQDQVMVEPQSESSADAPLIPWLERNADDPDDYDAACRELIPLVYKDEDERDPDKMLRRSDPKDLYRHLKHQHWYLVHSGAIPGIAIDNQISAISKSAERSQDVNAMDPEPPAHIMREFRNSVGQCGDGTAKIPAATLGEIPDARTNKQKNMTSNSEETEDEEEVEIIKWLDRYVGEPNDYEEASRKLLALLYSEDEECDAETTMSRSSPKELYRYLKQQYWYQMHMGTLSENQMRKGLQMSKTTSGESSALLERNKLIATVKNRISLIESTGVGEMYQHQPSSLVSPATSSPAGTFAVATQMAIEPQVGRHPQSSELIHEADDPVASGKPMQQLSSLMIEDKIVGFDDVDSFEASSSLEPPPHHSQTLIDDRKDRSYRPDNAEHHETQNTQNQGISMHVDPSSVHPDENSRSDIQMKKALPHAILDQVNEDKMPKLGEQHQVGREMRKTDATGSHADVQPFLHGPTLSDHPLKHRNDGTLETGSGLENSSTELNSDRSRFGNTGLQRSKRMIFTDSVRRHGSKRAKSEVGAPSGGIHNSGKPLTPGKQEQFQYSSGQTRSPLNHHQEKDLKDSFESEAIETLKIASLQIENSKRVEAEFYRPFLFSTSLAKGIIDGSLIRSASKQFRDGVDFPPDYTCALKRAATMMLDGDADSSKIGNSVVNVETMVEEQRRMWENASFSSNGNEENAGKQLSAHHDPGCRTRRINANIENTNADLQVGAVLCGRESREARTITGRSVGDKDISSSLSSLSSPANSFWQEDVNKVEHTSTSSTFDQVDMTKRQHIIKEELFSIVSDAENILGDTISEEMLAALILAATKLAHRKQYDNFAKDTIIYLPSVAKAVLDNSLLGDAARHFGKDISSQCINALKAASEKAVDRNLNNKYIESRAVTLNMTFPDKTIQLSKMSQSDLQSKEDVAAPKTSQAEKLTSVADEWNGANADVSNLLNDRTRNNEDEEGLGSTDLMELKEKAELQLAHYRDTKECLLKEYAEIEQEMSLDKERIAQKLDSLAGSCGLEQPRGDWKEASPNKASLARELKQLRESLASEKERLEKERNHPSSAASGGDKNTGLFGMFDVRRRAMDLEKEKEQQAKLMQQKIREMELEHRLTQMEMEIATVQQKYDNLLDQESAKTVEIADSSPSSNHRLNTKRVSPLQKSRKGEETFLEARKRLHERLHAFENRRRDDESWYWTKKRATMAKSESWNNRQQGESSKSDQNGPQQRDAAAPAGGTNGKESKRVSANLLSPVSSKQDRRKHLSLKACEVSHILGDQAKEERNPNAGYGEGQHIGLIESKNGGISKVGKTPRSGCIIPDNLGEVNQLATVHSSDMDSPATTELFGSSLQPLKTKPLLFAAQKAPVEVIQKPQQSSLTVTEQVKEEEDSVSLLDSVSRRVPDHSVGLNQQWIRSTDLKSLASVDISESPVSPGPDKLFIASAMEEMEAIAEQHGSEPSLNIQQKETDPEMKTSQNTPQGNGKKLLMLFSSSTIDRLQQTNQHCAIAVLKAQNIKYESLDGSDAISAAKRNKLFCLSNLQGTYPLFFVVEGASINFVGTFESIQDLNDRGLLERLLNDREEHYRQEFMELLECDDKGESMDKDRLDHLQLHARKRVGEELSTNEGFNLEEFEQKEAKLEKEESSNCSVLQRDPDRERKDSVDLQKAPSLGSFQRNGATNEGEWSSTKGEEEINHPPVLQQKKMEQVSPSMQGHPLSITLSCNWSPKNQKSLSIEQANLPEAFVRELGDEMLESQDVLKETDTLVSSKAALPNKTESTINEKKSRKEILAAKQKQIVELRRAKWGIQTEKNANSNEKKKSNVTSLSGSGASRLDPSMGDKRRKEKMAESKRLAEKTAKTREARLAREAELQKCTEQVKQKGHILSANLEKQSSAEEDMALSSLNIKKGMYVSSNGRIHQERSEHPLLVHLVKEVGRLSSFISRYEKKLETTCKSILSVAQTTSQEVDLKRVQDLGLPDMYNYIADQPWFKELTSEDFSWPLSMSKRRNEDIITSHLVAFNNPDDYVAADSSRPNDQANSRIYALSNLGKQFIKIDGPGAGDTGRFLTSLGSRQGWSKQQIVEIWSDISRLSGDDQSDRISKNIEHIMSFCLSSGFIG